MQDPILNSIITALKEQRADRLHRRWTPGAETDMETELVIEALAVLQAMQDAGWKPMPVTPTKEMIAAAHSGGHWGSVPEIYRSLVEAAPQIGEKANAD